MDRRKFIKLAGCTGMSSLTFLNASVNLKAMGLAAMDNSKLDDDYKALVCIQMSGGNDGYNTVVPMDPEGFADYRRTRSNMALDRNELIEFYPSNTDGRPFGFHPAFAEVEDLFSSGNCAVINNIGTLVVPTTKSQYLNGTVKLPLELYSHGDQVQQWQTGIATDRVSVGWGGRMADLIKDMNEEQRLSMAISLSGNNLYQQGKQTVPFSTGSWGPNTFWPLIAENPLQRAMKGVLEARYADAFKQTFVDVTLNAHEASQVFVRAYENRISFSTDISGSYLAESLRMIARTIASRKGLGVKRQIFYVSFGNFDYHDELINAQYRDLSDFSSSIGSFYQAMEELGVTNQVTTFTMSDFARTLTSNGNGTDHAWGSNALVFGGAVNGGKFYNEYPSLKLDSNLEVGGGVILPTLSTDEYFAELALWFGVSPNELGTIFPGLSNFYSASSGMMPIGFMG
jgi:uncharacterized protein (DUF1501 family)